MVITEPRILGWNAHHPHKLEESGGRNRVALRPRKKAAKELHSKAEGFDVLWDQWKPHDDKKTPPPFFFFGEGGFH